MTIIFSLIYANLGVFLLFFLLTKLFYVVRETTYVSNIQIIKAYINIKPIYSSIFFQNIISLVLIALIPRYINGYLVCTSLIALRYLIYLIVLIFKKKIQNIRNTYYAYFAISWAYIRCCQLHYST
jgi:hypothetical protein